VDQAASPRQAQLLAHRRAKLDKAFKGKRYTIVKKVKLEGNDRFVTPLGHKGKTGVILEEVGNPANKIIVGAVVLRVAADEYGAVDLPRRRMRTAEEVAAAAAAKAAAKAAREAARAVKRAEREAAKAALSRFKVKSVEDLLGG
jgi:hypothetical protein